MESGQLSIFVRKKRDYYKDEKGRIMVPFDYVLIGIAVLFLFFRVKDWIKGDRKYEDKEIESRKERRERKRCERELKKECKRHKRERAKDEERWGREYAEARRRSDVSRVR